MNAQKKQIRWLLGILVVGLISFSLLYLLGYQSAVLEREELIHQIQKVEGERDYFIQHQGSLEQIQQQVDSLSRVLKAVERRFLTVREFPRVLRETAALATPLGLQIFSADPDIESFEAIVEDTARVKPLYMMWRLRGSYLQIGKFLQAWENLPFYQMPVAVEIQRLEKKPRVLEARIRSRVFIMKMNEG
ncbi:MAG: hypothetical protein GXO78_13045 [Calditrichaeota bacterium]|nr:hypothetical protein [Calditrichota bacterium]